jgi:hypothetical protein
MNCWMLSQSKISNSYSADITCALRIVASVAVLLESTPSVNSHVTVGDSEEANQPAFHVAVREPPTRGMRQWSRSSR